MKFYHATLKRNIFSIKDRGIVPKIGNNSRLISESIERIYLFNTVEDLDCALSQWFGELFNDEDELIILEIELSEDDYYLELNHDLYESYYYKTIEFNKVTRLLEEDEI